MDLYRTPVQQVKKMPPILEGGLPYLGHAVAFNRNPVRFLQAGRERFGEIFSFRLAGSPVTVFLGPQASEAFFRASERQLSAKEAYQFTVPVFGKGISYDTTPERMNEQLSFLFPALRKQRLQTYAQLMAEEAEAYFEAWGAEGEVDLLNAMNELTMFIASRCLIGEEFRHNLTTEFARLYRDLEGSLNLLAFFKPDLPLPSFRRRDRARLR